MAKTSEPKENHSAENQGPMNQSEEFKTEILFCHSISQKHGAPLQLTKELATWFGDRRFGQFVRI